MEELLSDLLLEHLEEIQSAPQIVVGYSGGLDSSVLLHAVSQLELAADVLAVHVNHQLQSTSNEWESRCREHATQLGVPFYSERVEPSSESAVEESARRLRYEVFAKSLKPSGILLLGHHADDQIETVLFRLFRGAGLRGLTGMPERRPFAGGTLLRPLIKKTKKQLAKIARQADLTSIEDPSNQYNEYDRNYIRNELAPLISRRFPAAPNNILASSGHLSEFCDLATEIADEDLEKYDLRKEAVGESIDVGKLGDSSEVRQKNALNGWSFRLVGAQLNQKLYSSLVKTVLKAKEDASPLIYFANSEFRRFRGRLYLMRSLSDIAEKTDLLDKSWNTDDGALEFDTVWRLESVESPSKELSISFRAGGERMLPADRQHSQTLKKLLVEYEVEPWLRDYLPIIRDGEQIVAVGDRIFATNYRFQLQWLIEPQTPFR